jgi:AraC-like DNA-binding protein
MVSASCITVVQNSLERLGFHGIEARPGEVELPEDINDDQLQRIGRELELSGYELLRDRKMILIHQIKALIIELVYHSEEPLVENLSVYLSNHVHHDYTYLSNLFSEKLDITIEKFYICHKIERVKELLTNDELSLTDIAFKLHYSSVSHLSSQFKKVAGMTPSEFKQRKDNRRDLFKNFCR